jgi:hypothetical protein
MAFGTARWLPCMPTRHPRELWSRELRTNGVQPQRGRRRRRAATAAVGQLRDCV